MKYRFFLLLISVFAALDITVAKPRLVVNIVVGSMRAEDVTRYEKNFTEGGLKRLLREGTVYTDSRFDYQQTLTPVSLATITTGAQPSTHGVIGRRWFDYTSNLPVQLIGESENPHAHNLIAPTLTETLLRHSHGSRAVTIALEPMSAVVMGGHSKQTFWMDERCQWTSSENFVGELPNWISRINREKYNLSYIRGDWYNFVEQSKYVNERHWDIHLSAGRRQKNYVKKTNRLDLRTDYERLLHTPGGNDAVFGFAKLAIAQYQLGEDETPDILNICLDTSRRITEVYGPESVEVEDMIYRLDNDLEDFLTFVFAQVKDGNVVVMLTANHGSSPSLEESSNYNLRFNARQFEVIVNGFLNVRYGSGNWVLACENKCLWLNHNLIYERGLNLSEVQNEVAIFAMQFSGVSHALAASAMRTSYFGSGYARKLQNSFYPRRSGDVILNLMPGWIEEQERCWSVSGSMYGYDTQVPLIFYGAGIPQQHVGRRVDMTAIAPTLAHLLEITEPAASEGEVLKEIIQF